MSKAISLLIVLPFLVMCLLVSLASANPLPIIKPEKTVPRQGAIPPIITISDPKNCTAYNANNLPLNFSLKAPTGTNVSSQSIKVLYYKIDGQIGGETYPGNDSVILYGAGLGLPFPRMSSLSLTGLTEGDHNVTVVVWYTCSYPSDENSSSGYIFYIQGISTVNFSVDTTSPTISNISLDNKTYKTADVPINFTTNEPVYNVFYTLDGQEKLVIPENRTLTGLSNGIHNVTVYASDIAGNIGVSETLFFTVTVPPSFPTVPVAIAATFSIICVGAIYVKKRKS